MAETVEQREGRVMVARTCPHCGTREIESTSLGRPPVIGSCILEGADGQRLGPFGATRWRLAIGPKSRPPLWRRIWAAVSRPFRRKLPGEEGSDNGYARRADRFTAERAESAEET